MFSLSQLNPAGGRFHATCLYSYHRLTANPPVLAHRRAFKFPSSSQPFFPHAKAQQTNRPYMCRDAAVTLTSQESYTRACRESYVKFDMSLMPERVEGPSSHISFLRLINAVPGEPSVRTRATVVLLDLATARKAMR